MSTIFCGVSGFLQGEIQLSLEKSPHSTPAFGDFSKLGPLSAEFGESPNLGLEFGEFSQVTQQGTLKCVQIIM